jgi:hypothetical protein
MAHAWTEVAVWSVRAQAMDAGSLRSVWSLPRAVPLDTWSRTFGGNNEDWGEAVQPTSDGGYIVVGWTRPSDAGDFDLWLIKTDAHGNKVWDRTFGGAGTDQGYSVQQTSDGGYVVTGKTCFGAGALDVWLIKTDATGAKVWDRTFGGVEGEYGNSVQQTSDGGYIIAAETDSYGAGANDAWLIKTDADGNKVWDRTFGSAGYQFGRSARQTSDGGYILLGGIIPDTSALEWNIWLIKTDADGNEVWDRTFGGADNDYGNSVQQTSDGGYIVAGHTPVAGTASPDVWLIKTDANGDKTWDKTFDGTNMDYGNSVQQTSDGGYVITGETMTRSDIPVDWDVWLIKTDANGDKVWDKTFGGENWDFGRSVQQTPDGGYVITGKTQSYGAGGSDILLIKTFGP